MMLRGNRPFRSKLRKMAIAFDIFYEYFMKAFLCSYQAVSEHHEDVLKNVFSKMYTVSILCGIYFETSFCPLKCGSKVSLKITSYDVNKCPGNSVN